MVRKLLVVVLAAALMAGGAWAAEMSWTGDADETWDGANWAEDGGGDVVPGSGNDLTIDTAVTGDVITVDSDGGTAKTLTVDGVDVGITTDGGALTITESITVTNGGKLTLDGDTANVMNDPAVINVNGNSTLVIAKALGTTDLIDDAALSLDGGTLELGAAMTVDNAIAVGAGGATVNVGAHTTTLSSALSGAGTLTLKGDGATEVTLSTADNSGYNGGVNINGVDLTATQATLGTGVIGFVEAGGELNLGGAGVTNNFNVQATGQITASGAITLEGDIAGAAGKALTLTAGGAANKITLEGDNSGFAGDMVVDNATVVAGSLGTGKVTLGSAVNAGNLELAGNIEGVAEVAVDAGTGDIVAKTYNFAAAKLSGAGALEITGDDGTATTVNLGDASAYTGDLTVADDKVAVAVSKMNAAGVIAIGEAASFTLDSATDVTRTANITGDGTFIKAGAGTLAFGAQSLTAKTINVTGGALSVNGTTFGLGGGTVAVSSGATLNVDGATTVSADSLNMGAGSTLALNAGALTMTGKELILTSGTKLTAIAGTIAGLTDASRITLNETALTDDDAGEAAFNTYLATQSTGGIATSTAFEYDRTAGSVTGATRVTSASDQAAIMTDILNANDAGHMASGLNAGTIGTWAGIIAEHTLGTAYTGQGKTTADLMNTYFNNGGGAVSSGEMQSVVSTLAGYDSAKSLDIAMITANNVTGRIQSRVASNNLARASAESLFGSNSALASSALNSSFANRFWFGGFGLWEDADKRGFDNGYKYKSGGFITGYDKVFGAVTLGGSFAYTAGSYEDKNALASDSDIDSYAFTLYGTYNHCSGFFATLMGGYTYSDYNMSNLLTKAGQWDKSDFHANTWTIGGTLGYDFRPTQCLTITPSIGLYHYTSSTNTFSTTIRNNMKVEQDSTELPIDVAVNYDIPTASGNLRLTANTGYAYSFSKDGGELDGFGYNGIAGSRISGIKGRENARHTWNLGAGATYSTGRFDIGVKYDYYAKSDYNAHRVMGTVGISF